jgi:hypothetical protein
MGTSDKKGETFPLIPPYVGDREKGNLVFRMKKRDRGRKRVSFKALAAE